MVWKKKFSTIFQLSLSVLDNLHFEKIFHFQSSYLVHRLMEINETPADWKEILSPLWFGLKERKLVKDAIGWGERV